MKRLHAVLAVAWLLFAAPCILIPAWRGSVPLLVFISIYANVAGHFSAWQSVRAEHAAEDK